MRLGSHPSVRTCERPEEHAVSGALRRRPRRGRPADPPARGPAPDTATGCLTARLYEFLSNSLFRSERGRAADTRGRNGVRKTTETEEAI